MKLPHGVRVLGDGAWTVDGLPIVHRASLLYLKRRLVFEEGGAFVVDGPQRMPVSVEGPSFEVMSLLVDADRGEVRAVLDDGSSETLGPDALWMDAETGRFQASVRGGRGRAHFSRQAHHTLLEHAEQEDGRFYLRAGATRIAVRT